MQFISPTKGVMSFDRVFRDIISYIEEEPQAKYKLIIGTDSHTREDVCFVSAIIVHRVGKGGRYYYHRKRDKKFPSLKQRIFYEAAMSMGIASRLAEKLAQKGHSELDVEIHLDIGQNGQTRELIKEIVGMVTGSGFHAEIKPNSYGASKVADKHSK
ncbi:MAG TPA: hypothetical protein GXX40_03040 [Firmicutes bacterium]|nr:hypothetical protein [Bacillota bacterium]